MKKLRMLAGALVTGAALALLAPMSPAQAASCSITPKSATLYEKSKNVTFGVAGAKDWSIEISDLFVYVYANESLGSENVEQMDPVLFTNSDAGLHAAAVDKDNNDCSASFRLLRGSTLSAKAVKSGSSKKVSGTLKRVSFGWSGGYTGYAGQKVQIQFKSPTSGKWIKAGTVSTKKGGSFSFTKKIGKRQWRAVYGGSSTTGSRTSATRTA